MAGPSAGGLLPHRHGSEIADALLGDPLNLDELGYNGYPSLPLQDLPQPCVREIYNKCSIKQACVDASNLPRTPEQIPCLAAPVLVSLIISLNYRKIAASGPDKAVLDMFGTHSSVSWLNVAIQALAKAGSLPGGIQNPDFHQPDLKNLIDLWIDYRTYMSRDLFNKLLDALDALDEDFSAVSWEETVHCEKTEMLCSDVAEPFFKILADFIKQIPEHQGTRLSRHRVNGTFKDLKNIFQYHHEFYIQQTVSMEKLAQSFPDNNLSISNETRGRIQVTLMKPTKGEFEAQERAPQFVVDLFKVVYALFRKDGVVVPQELHSMAASSLSTEQYREVVNCEVDHNMYED
ncbi:hypothetical protein FBEOM_11454 [Fusarium beomiforme]|uniref:Uncharacterized protein n=1 Tax=Fusarium beomiforme TaxID=44412 RepID=A0A9P5AAH5_9HYPO|nr:hypothetical protein FBEOM_11454 [Fusarium beomiforme]